MQSKSAPSKSPTFKLALGFFVLLGFAQLMAVGVAYTARAGKVEKVVEYKQAPPVVIHKYLEVENPVEVKFKTNGSSAEEIVGNVLKHENLESILGETPLQDSVMVDGGKVDIRPAGRGYVVRDPLVAKLLKASELAYSQGNMGEVILKLDEAQKLDPKEPALLYQFARVAEDLGQLEKAKEYYLEIFSLGYSAGKFYERAAHKLEHGIGKKAAEGAVMLIGAVNISRGEHGKQSKVTVPIKAKEGEDIVSDFVEVQVHFYDKKDDKEVVEAADNANIHFQWANAQVNWNDNAEEVLDVTYKIPAVDEVQQHLFGSRAYFGQVVELYYKGELQDIIAHPTTLHKVHAQKNQHTLGEGEDFPMPFEFNEANPLLPELPQIDDSDLPSY